jgi:hypothetical protein
MTSALADWTGWRLTGGPDYCLQQLIGIPETSRSSALLGRDYHPADG